eukprot:8501846-Heterocapsa_arctica.AAC.1
MVVFLPLPVFFSEALRVCGWLGEVGVLGSSLGVGGIVQTGRSRRSAGAGGVGAHGSIAGWRSSRLWGGCVVILVPGAMVTGVLSAGSNKLILPSLFTD